MVQLNRIHLATQDYSTVISIIGIYTESINMPNGLLLSWKSMAARESVKGKKWIGGTRVWIQLVC